MPSTFAWLAVDAEKRRRMMEAVDQFRDRTTVDDLGIGSIRDAFSDTLFPGTSTLQTRLRYALFIPWLMQEAGRSGDVEEMTKRFQRVERAFITALERGTDEDEPGIIGRRAGATLQRAPSELYLGMLVQWGLLEPGLSTREYFRRTEVNRELVARSHRLEDEGQGPQLIPDGIDPYLPAQPDGLLRSADFRLTPHEARYLQEMITRRTPGTLLARLADSRPPTWLSAKERSSAPWAPEIFELLDPEADGALRNTLDLAERFSLSIRGASLLYNLLLAEATSEDHERFPDDRVQHYRELLHDWADEAVTSRPLDARDLLYLGQLMATRQRTFADKTRIFLEYWSAEARSPHAVADSPSARQLVSERERWAKGGRARLRPGNLKALNSWSGASGTARLNFRWAYVATLLQDLYDGEENS